MATRRKRSISVPPDLDDQIEAAAAKAGMTYSGWLTQTARREFTIRAGLDAVGEYEREHGRFTDKELADAEEWAKTTIRRSKRSGRRKRRSA